MTPEEKISAAFRQLSEGFAELAERASAEPEKYEPLKTLPRGDDILTVAEVAERYRVSKATVYGWINRAINPLPVLPTPGSVKRVCADVLVHWFATEGERDERPAGSLVRFRNPEI